MRNPFELLANVTTLREVSMQGAMLSGELAQIIGKSIANAEDLEPESPLGAVVYHGGDFVNTYTIAAATDIFIRAYYPNVPDKTRRYISSAVSTVGLLIAEFASLPNNMLGTPDIKDIPAGLLGIGAYHLMNRAVCKYPPYDTLAKVFNDDSSK